MTAPRRRLGKTELEITPVGLGCWQFAGGAMGGVGWYWEAIPQPAINDVVAAALKGGVSWFDTAEAYGNGESERRLSIALTAAGKKPGEVVIATKWQPVGRTAASIGGTIGKRLDALKPWPIDLHQVHQAWGFSSVEAEMNAMAELVAAKKIRAVGISNFNAALTRRADAALKAKGLSLASNQVKYSLLDRHIEGDGLLAAAKELGVTIIAWSPLEQGILTGRFHDNAAEAPTGVRRFMGKYKGRGLERSRPLVEELKKIAAAHGATCSQVALAWLLQFHGDTVVVIPGATSARQAELNASSMDLALTHDELRRIDEASHAFV